MNRLPLIAVLALATTANAAQASVTVIGGGLAERCYLAAEAGDTSRQALDKCSRALTEEMLSSNDRVATHVNRGILYFQRAAVPEAFADFDRAIELDSSEPDAWMNKAILTVRYGKAIDALPMIQEALSLGTRRPALAYFVRGLIQEERGNITAAYRDYQRAHALEPGWTDPVTELARFQVRQP